jgi:hypothetical protein
MSSADASKEPQSPPLLEVARALVAVTDLRPAKAEQFIADWWAQWEHAKDDDPEAYRDLLNRFMFRYVDYLTTDQRVQFIRDNLPSQVAQHHFQRCIALLVEQSSDLTTIETLQGAGEAAERLTGWELHAILGDLAGPVGPLPDPWGK